MHVEMNGVKDTVKYMLLSMVSGGNTHKGVPWLNFRVISIYIQPQPFCPIHWQDFMNDLQKVIGSFEYQLLLQ